MDNYEVEILGLLKKLEVRIKWKTIRPDQKGKCEWIKVGEGDLEIGMLSYKSGLSCGRRGGMIFRDLVRVSQ